MLKAVVLLLVTLLITSSAYAANGDIAEGMKKKATRGAINLVTGVAEIPIQIYKGFKNGSDLFDNELFSRTAGTIQGIVRGATHFLGRTSWGALELIGFWSANPEDNKGVGLPLDTEYVWEKSTQDSSPEFALKPIGEKLNRGLVDGLFGIMEVPGQTIKGAKEGDILAGFGRGVWFWLSREVYGIASLCTSLVPNPTDNPGYNFEQDRPWDAFSESIK